MDKASILPVLTIGAALDMARGLVVYHKLEYANRDVKCSNVMAVRDSSDERGHHLAVHDNTHAIHLMPGAQLGGRPVGTPGYRAPEAIYEAECNGVEVGLSGIAPGKPADVYSLGHAFAEVGHQLEIPANGQRDHDLPESQRLCVLRLLCKCSLLI